MYSNSPMKYDFFRFLAARGRTKYDEPFYPGGTKRRLEYHPGAAGPLRAKRELIPENNDVRLNLYFII